jgi:lysophospholipase L1-like esterase
MPINPSCSDAWAFTPASLLQSDFDLHPEVGPVIVVAKAVPGSTFDDIVNGTGPATQTLASMLASVRPNMVISDSGVNDRYVEGESPAQYASSELGFVSAARAGNALPVMIEPTPICRSDANNEIWSQFVSTENTIAQANAYPVLKLASAWIADQNWCDDYMSSDFVHPSAAGYAFRETQIFPQLLAIVRQQKGL